MLAYMHIYTYMAIRAGPLWASLGPYGPGRYGLPWALMGRALMGLALMAPPGSLWAGPSWAPGPSWAGCL